MIYANTGESASPVPASLTSSAPSGERRTVHLVTLGCARNRVDSEVTLGSLLQEGWMYVEDPGSAELIVINTCGFIESAKTESIDTILELSEYKKLSAVTLVVMGCLSGRYKTSLMKALPEVDIFCGSDQFAELPAILKRWQQERIEHQQSSAAPSSSFPQKLYAQRTHALYDELSPRLNTLHSHCAYVKIAEGCQHRCAFCIIPAIRGRLRSRSIASVHRECQQLSQSGIKEINLVAQDLAAYGRDRGHDDLLPLLQRLSDLEKIAWIRLLYMYPENISAEFLDFFATEPKLVKYLDVPVQHGNSQTLMRMNRCVQRSDLLRIFRQVRSAVPDVCLRTSVMVGFPGETDKEFADLCSLIEEVKFHHLGCFAYSQEHGTRAAAMPHQVPEEIKLERQQHVMAIQREISAQILRSYRHQQHIMFIETPILSCDVPDQVPASFRSSPSHGPHSTYYRGRLSFQAPEVDGITYLEVPSPAPSLPSQDSPQHTIAVGTLLPIKITDTSEYDIKACPV